ncbi:transposase [Streptococcus pneumoniae]|nr:transposase [Streptococcus pneumoniae]
MSRVRVQIMNQFHRKSHEYKAIKRYWKLIQQDSRKLSDKTDFYRFEHQKRKDEICPFSSLADFNPLQLTKSLKFYGSEVLLSLKIKKRVTNSH